MRKKITIRSLALAMLLTTLLSATLFGATAYAADGSITFAEGAVTAGDGVTVDGTTATITEAGTYTLSGTSGAGKVVVNCTGDVTLVLSGLTLTSADGPVIDIQDAGQATIELAAGTENTLSDAGTYATATDSQDAAVFSRADLVITGEGSLTVHGLYNDGIASRDTLRIEGGSITVDAVNHGIKGKDYLIVQGGTVTVTAGGDAIKATNADQAELGYVQVDGGTLNLTAGDDGISGVSAVTVNGGDITIDTVNNGVKSEGTLDINAGTMLIITADDDFVADAPQVAAEANVTVQQK